MSAYYNEHDPKAAAWLRELIKAKLIADGEVDERSIEDIRPSELGGFTQCHFFAGIGGWSRALRLAGWPDDRPVWTGSCPCQSFSAAGQGKGFADERHLWPAWHHLISERKPAVVFGEQVDAAIKFGWIDLVQTDMEATDYAFGFAIIPAAGVGAPHGRHRIFYVAYAKNSDRWCRVGIAQARTWTNKERWFGSASDRAVSGMAIADLSNKHGRPPGGEQQVHEVGNGQSSALVNTEIEQARVSRFAWERRKTNGFWLDADWIPCRDGKWCAIQKPESEFLLLDDGLFYRLDHVLSAHIEETSLEVMRHATSSRTNPSEIMQMVQDTVNSESLQRASGGQRGIPEAAILLGFLRDVLSACNRPADNSGWQKACAEDDPRMLRDLHEYVKAVCSSHRRESEEQLSGEPANSMQQLSWFLARCCKTRWDYEARAYATNFPLSGYVKGRMDLLRGFGNAIVPQVGAAFISAYMENQ